MPIQVTCPSCHQRFSVSEKFAGQEGPCPKCKGKIRVPKLDEQVVIHAPETAGPKSVTGAPVLKPIKRRDTRLSVPLIACGSALVVLAPLAALVIGRMSRTGDGQVSVSTWLLGLGAAIVAPPLVWLAYEFLRNVELEGYMGRALWIRIAICSLVYAGLWGLCAYFKHMLLEDTPPEMMHMLIILPAMFVPGALASMATLDLDGTSAAIHYAAYLGATVVLRLLVGLHAF